MHYLFNLLNTIDVVVFVYNGRLIPEKERSFALGVQWTVSKCLGKYLNVFPIIYSCCCLYHVLAMLVY